MKYDNGMTYEDRLDRMAEYGEAESPEDERQARAHAWRQDCQQSREEAEYERLMRGR